MTKVAIIRCEKNENTCPMTACFQCITEHKEGFERYSECILTGVFTCRCPGINAIDLAKILKSKGVEAIHFCTCAFARKTEKGWRIQNGGFCGHADTILEDIHKETELPCVKGTAHLPKYYTLKVWEHVN